MMAELQFIVERLNEPPVSLGLTLVTFDEKSGVELLQLFVNVLSDLDPRVRCDVRDEPPDALVAKVVDLLRVLKCPLPADDP